MWDIDTIMAQHNQAALNELMEGIVSSESRSPQPKGWALSRLADILQVGPPRLEEIVNCLNLSERYKEFVSIVEMLLPEYRAEITTAPRNKRVYQFCFYYGKKYYPLPANMDCHPADWVDGMPVELFGMSYTAYHDLSMRAGYLLLLSLVVYPYRGDERDEEDDAIPYDPFDPMKKMRTKMENEAYKPTAKDASWLRKLLANLADGGEWIAPVGFKVVKLAANKIQLTNVVDNPDAKGGLAPHDISRQESGH